jgi:hypothetical protein
VGSALAQTTPVPAGARLDGMTRCIRLGAAALAVVALTGLAGCRGKASAGPSPSASALTEAQIVAILQEYTQCMHDHGISSYQQPELVDGKVQWERNLTGVDPDTMDAATAACKPIADKLPAGVAGRPRELTAAEIAKLRQFASCMRQHGYPDWPDPDSQGRLPIQGTPMEQVLDKNHQLPQECDQYLEGVSKLRMTTP